MPMPDPETATDRVFHEGDEELVLGDGNAPWSGHAQEA
jgi:1,2-phenylacetyl-CoA epoxidase catalytic subunit